MIGLHPKDVCVLEFIKKELEYTGPIRTVTPTKTCKNNVRTLTISSSKICKDLIRLGCVPRKSLVLKFPLENQVPKCLVYHFIRGYFDGDGSISNTASQCYACVNEQFGRSMVKILKSFGVYSYLYKVKNGKIFRLRITKKKDFLRFMELMYKDSKNLRLDRKFNQYNIKQ